jgi:AbiV family abortive infection protein
MTQEDKRVHGVDAATIAATDACRIHARALLESAKAVRAANHCNIAYHLATLALEELGKRHLLQIQAMAGKRDVSPAWPGKHTQDHVKKLFWSFFGVEFLAGTITKAALESLDRLANTIHGKRLAGLYVDVGDDGLSLPGDAVTPAECDDLLNLAEARLGIAEAETVPDTVTEGEEDLATWFLDITDDPEKRKLVLSSGSLNKLGELKDVKAWGTWLKKQFADAESEGRAAADRELKRATPADGTPLKNKWRIRFRILCGSHSIRPKALTAWNKDVDWIKLSAVSGKKDQLDVEFTLLDHVPAAALWFYGWGLARHFVTALNIGTMGFFWWRFPEQVDRYYTRIDDLENGMEMAITRSPSLKIDWGENRVLTEEDLNRVKACFLALPDPDEREKQPAFGFYIGGITFLSLNDIHWQCEGQAFGNFFECLRAMMREYGDWGLDDEPFRAAFLRFVNGMFPELDESDQLADLCDRFGARDVQDAKVTLKEATFMKFFCDSYFMKVVQPKRLQEKQAKFAAAHAPQSGSA